MASGQEQGDAEAQARAQARAEARAQARAAQQARREEWRERARQARAEARGGARDDESGGPRFDWSNVADGGDYDMEVYDTLDDLKSHISPALFAAVERALKGEDVEFLDI
jgi:EXLDI family protein